MNEKEIKDKAEQIVEALTALSLGKEPNMLSSDVFKKLAQHNNFSAIKEAYISFLQTFDGNIDAPEEIKRLFDFRLHIVALFEAV